MNVGGGELGIYVLISHDLLRNAEKRRVFRALIRVRALGNYRWKPSGAGYFGQWPFMCWGVYL